MTATEQSIIEAIENTVGPATLQSIATRTGLTPETVRRATRRLSEAGRVQTVELSTGQPGRPPLAFEVVE